MQASTPFVLWTERGVNLMSDTDHREVNEQISTKDIDRLLRADPHFQRQLKAARGEGRARTKRLEKVQDEIANYTLVLEVAEATNNRALAEATIPAAEKALDELRDIRKFEDLENKRIVEMITKSQEGRQ